MSAVWLRQQPAQAMVGRMMLMVTMMYPVGGDGDFDSTVTRIATCHW